MLYLGIDQHARQITISLRDDNCDVLLARQVSTQPEKIHAFFQQLTTRPGRLAIIKEPTINNSPTSRESRIHFFLPEVFAMKELRRSIPTVGSCCLIVITMTLCLRSVFAQNAVNNAGPPPIQWEYKVIQAQTEMTFIRHLKLQSQLTELGVEGWECVGTISEARGDSTRGHVILKRARQTPR